MGEGDERHVDAGHPPDLRRVHAAGVDHELGLDRALVGHDLPHPAVLDLDAGDSRVLADLGASPSRPLDQGEGELAGVDVAVGREKRRSEHALGAHRWKHPLRVRRRDELEGQAERLRPRGLARELLHALLAGGEAQRTDLVPARLQADLFLQRSIEVDRVHHHPGQAERAAELADQTRGVKGGAAGEAGALDQDDIRPAEAREPVEDGRAADTAADDDGARVGPQELVRRVPPRLPRPYAARSAARSPSRQTRRR